MKAQAAIETRPSSNRRSGIARRLRFRCVLACVMGAMWAVSLLGCGSSGNGLPAQVRNDPSKLQILSAKDVSAQPADSPQRTVFEWWRLMQFRNGADALKLFAPSVRPQLLRGDYATAVVLDFGPWLTHLRPRVLNVDQTGGHAVVYLTMISKQLIGSKVTRQAQGYVGLPLDRIGQRWLLSDSSFFRAETDVARAARERANQSAPKRS